MMTVIIYCLVISSAFLFLPQFVSSPFSGTGGNCGVLLPRQTVGGAFPCFLRCCIWFEDMLWEWFEYSVCVWGGGVAGCVSHSLFLTLWFLNSEDISDRTKWEKRQTSLADHHCGLATDPRAWRANSKNWKTDWQLTTCGEFGCHSEVLSVCVWGGGWKPLSHR